MNKTIILIEDDLSQVQDMLLSIQSIVFISSKMGLVNSPQNFDTKYVYFILYGMIKNLIVMVLIESKEYLKLDSKT